MSAIGSGIADAFGALKGGITPYRAKPVTPQTVAPQSALAKTIAAQPAPKAPDASDALVTNAVQDADEMARNRKGKLATVLTGERGLDGKLGQIGIRTLLGGS